MVVRAWIRLARALVLMVVVGHGFVTVAKADLVSLFGDERVGTSGGQFLRVPVGARPIALGGGATATVSGPNAIFWNPAAMVKQRERHAVVINHTEYAADLDVDHAAYTYRNASWQFGMGLGALRSGDIERTTEFHPNGTGQTFEANQFLAAVAASRALTDRFTLGATVKLLQENLDDFENRGVFIDIGATYRTGYNNARMGFVVRNFGAEMRLNGSPPVTSTSASQWQTFAAPTIAVFGAAYDFSVMGQRRWTWSMDFSHPSDDTERLVWGSELAVGKDLFLRGGYRTGVLEGGFSGGFGLRIGQSGRRRPFSLDYAAVDRGGFGVLHTISLELRR
jgi:hypothetical protein